MESFGEIDDVELLFRNLDITRVIRTREKQGGDKRQPVKVTLSTRRRQSKQMAGVIEKGTCWR